VVTLNHAVAVAMVRGAPLLEMTGDRVAAREGYLAAAGQTTSVVQQRYLRARAARLAVERDRPA
jgi:predicted RNA polymerase sigma factor